MTIALAMLAALGYAFAATLQQDAARLGSAPAESTVVLMARLLRDPRWLAAGIAELLAIGLHVAALHAGALSIVQAILPIGLVFALAMSARVQQRVHHSRVWVAAALVTIGTAGFVAVLGHSGGDTNPSKRAWITLIVVSGAVAGVAAAMGTTRSQPRGAVYLSVAAGVLYGLAAALTKPTVDALTLGAVPLLRSWAFYTLLVVAGSGFVLGQRAFQRAPLAVSLPILTIADPVVGVAIGVGAYREHLRLGGVRGAFAALFLLAMAIGATVLARDRHEGSVRPGTPTNL